MSVSELNHLMTYVIEGWMLFSAGFTSIAFVSFVAKRVQEDIEAAELAQTEGQAEGQTVQLNESQTVTVAETVEPAIAQTASAPKAQTPKAQTPAPKKSAPKTPLAQNTDEVLGEEAIADETEKARLKEVAAVSEKLAKIKDKQSGSSSVSVSARTQ